MSPTVLIRRRLLAWAVAVVVLTVAFAFWPSLSSGGGWSTGGVGIGCGMTLLIFFLALGCEYVDSSLGMGYGTSLTPILLLLGFEPLQIVPAVLSSEFLTGAAAGILHHRDGNVDLLRDARVRETLVWLSSLTVVGATAAVMLALRIPRATLSALVALIVLSMGVVILATTRRRLRYRRRHIVIVGLVAAFNKGLSGGGYGPLVTGGQVVSGVSPRQAVAITSLTESLTCLVALVAFVLGSGTIHLGLAVPLTVGALCSVPIATLTVRVASDRFIRYGIGWVVCLLGIITLLKVVF